MKGESCSNEGVMPDDLQRDLLRQATSAEFTAAIYRLAALSHLSPVTDRYGYNAMVSSPEYIVSDLMLRSRLAWESQPDLIQVQIPVGNEVFGLVINPHTTQVELIDIDQRSVIRSGRFEPADTTPSAIGAPGSWTTIVGSF